METLLFLLDGVLVALLCFMSLQDERRPRGTAATSLFRFRESLDARPAPRRQFVPGTYHEETVRDLGGRPRR